MHGVFRPILRSCATARRSPAGLFAVLWVGLLLVAPGARAQSVLRATTQDSLLVRSVSFTGDLGRLDDTLSADDLQPLLLTRPSPGGFATFLWSIGERMPFAAEPQYFDGELFQNDLEVLRGFYRNNGFLSASVHGDSTTAAAGGDGVHAVVHVEAGPRSHIDTVIIRNLDLIVDTLYRGSALLRREIDSASLLYRHAGSGMRAYAPYNSALVEGEAGRILKLLGNNGYPFASIENIAVERKLSDNGLVIRFPLKLGPRLRFGPRTDSLTDGNPPNLKGDIIQGRMEFETGRLYSRQLRDRAEANMNRLGIYAGVRLIPHFPAFGDSVHTLVPMTLLLTPKDQHELLPSAGLNSQYGRLNAFTGVAYLFHNPFREAQTFSTRIDVMGKIDWPISNYQTSLQLRLDQPYLFQNDVSASAALSYVIANEEGNYSGNILQFLLGTRWRAADRVQATADWTAEQSQYDEVVTSLTNSVFAGFDTTGVNFRNSILTLGVHFDYTNDFFNPTTGRSFKATVEEAGLLKQAIPGFFGGYQSAEYVKLEGLYTQFTDMSANATGILGVKLRLGAIIRYGDSRREGTPVPVYRRYYAGGSTGVRAWHSRSLSVEGEQRAASGGHALVEASVEYRWKLFPGAREWLFIEPDNIWIVAFADAGNLWPDPSKVRLSEQAAGIGIGLRYNLFFGPIRVDYAVRAYDPLAAENPWMTQRRFWSEVFSKGVIQLGIGHAF
jgi:outer membrane protein assembly factor BamA